MTTTEKKPTLDGVYVEKPLANPQPDQIVIYHNKAGKSRVSKISSVSDDTVKIDGSFDIPKSDIYTAVIVDEQSGNEYPLHARWWDYLNKNRFDYKNGKRIKFFVNEDDYGVFINKSGFKDVNYFDHYFETFLSAIRKCENNSDARDLFFKHNYKVVRVPKKKEEN